MRIEEFTMERDVLEIGDVVDITEGALPLSYYYIAEPAAAMSKNFPGDKRILSKQGKVISKELHAGTYTLMLEFDEEEK